MVVCVCDGGDGTAKVPSDRTLYTNLMPSGRGRGRGYPRPVLFDGALVHWSR